jgi:hypothetical protein
VAEQLHAAPDPGAPVARKPHWSALAIVLLVIGLLILIPSGLCTGVFAIGALLGALSAAGTAIPTFLMTLVLGGIPTAIGAALVYAALRLRRRG